MKVKIPQIAKIISLIALSFVACGGEGRVAPPQASSDGELNRCLRLSAQKKYEQAVECLEIFKSRYPTEDRAADADLLIADSYFRQKEYLLSAEAYQEFIKRYPYHAKTDYAYYKSGQAYLNENPKSIARDQQYLEVAAQNFEIVAKYYPNSPYHATALQNHRKAMNRMAHKNYSIARFYYKYGEYLASIPRFEEVVTNFANLGFDEKSFYYLIDAYLKTKQPERAREAVLRFEERFPRSGMLKDVKPKVQGTL